jgi:VanZ family protein
VKKKIIKETMAWLPAILWAALIFHFSSGRIPVASPVYWQDFTIKKTGHVLLFGTLAILIYRGLLMDGVSRKKAAIYAVLLAFFYGGSDEFHQMFTQGRESTVRDVFIDGGGATLAILLIYNFISKLPKKFQSFLLELGFK